MTPDTTHKTMLTVLIIIGIVIIFILLAPRAASTGYSYQNGTIFTASAVPFSDTRTTTTQTGTYSFVRYIPHTSSRSSTNSTYTYYSYPTTTYTDGTAYDNGTVFPDGCTLTSPVSTTTGEPCS